MILLQVSDNGIGFDLCAANPTTTDSLGLRGMHQRAQHSGWRLRVRTRPGTGTKIVVHWPLPEPPSADQRAADTAGAAEPTMVPSTVDSIEDL